MRPGCVNSLSFMIENIEALNDYVSIVNNQSNYWMVRTMGGEYYHDFIDNEFIAIGYNEILLNTIRQLNEDNSIARRQLREIVTSVYHDTIRPGQVVSQLLRFCREIKIGDIIVVPNSNHEISICRVTGDVYEDVNAGRGGSNCIFMKRISIKILKQTRRFMLPPKAQLMFNSRHPISDISHYAMYIDDSVCDFYNKNEETHLSLAINTENEVSATVFYNIQKLFKITGDFCLENGIEGTADDVVMKVQMESKGKLHFISSKKSYLALLALGILFINGGGLRINYNGFNLDLSTDGLFKKYDEYMDRKVDRELRMSIKNSLDSLDIKTPEDYTKAVIELYKTQNANRNTY